MVTSICQIVEPTSYQRVVVHPGWRDSMAKEFTALESNHTWEVIEFPQGRKELPDKWVYKVKLKFDGSLE